MLLTAGVYRMVCKLYSFKPRVGYFVSGGSDIAMVRFLREFVWVWGLSGVTSIFMLCSITSAI